MRTDLWQCWVVLRWFCTVDRTLNSKYLLIMCVRYFFGLMHCEETLQILFSWLSSILCCLVWMSKLIYIASWTTVDWIYLIMLVIGCVFRYKVLYVLNCESLFLFFMGFFPHVSWFADCRLVKNCTEVMSRLRSEPAFSWAGPVLSLPLGYTLLLYRLINISVWARATAN